MEVWHCPLVRPMMFLFKLLRMWNEASWDFFWGLHTFILENGRVIGWQFFGSCSTRIMLNIRKISNNHLEPSNLSSWAIIFKFLTSNKTPPCMMSLTWKMAHCVFSFTPIVSGWSFCNKVLVPKRLIPKLISSSPFWLWRGIKIYEENKTLVWVPI